MQCILHKDDFGTDPEVAQNQFIQIIIVIYLFYFKHLLTRYLDALQLVELFLHHSPPLDQSRLSCKYNRRSLFKLNK